MKPPLPAKKEVTPSNQMSDHKPAQMTSKPIQYDTPTKPNEAILIDAIQFDPNKTSPKKNQVSCLYLTLIYVELTDQEGK